MKMKSLSEWTDQTMAKACLAESELRRLRDLALEILVYPQSPATGFESRVRSQLKDETEKALYQLGLCVSLIRLLELELSESDSGKTEENSASR